MAKNGKPQNGNGSMSDEHRLVLIRLAFNGLVERIEPPGRKCSPLREALTDLAIGAEHETGSEGRRALLELVSNGLDTEMKDAGEDAHTYFWEPFAGFVRQTVVRDRAEAAALTA